MIKGWQGNLNLMCSAVNHRMSTSIQVSKDSMLMSLGLTPKQSEAEVSHSQTMAVQCLVITT